MLKYVLYFNINFYLTIILNLLYIITYSYKKIMPGSKMQNRQQIEKYFKLQQMQRMSKYTFSNSKKDKFIKVHIAIIINKNTLKQHRVDGEIKGGV